MATELDRLRGEVADLRAVITDLADTLSETIPRKELRRTLQRWWVLGLAIMLAFVLGAVGINRVTLNQSRQDLTEQVTTCFLRPAAITPAQVAACDARFTPDDHAYLQVQAQSRQAGATFVKLQQRVAHLEAEVARLRE